ncbi:MAG: VCBS repeat-containing protein [Asgard group archaeon]|nr:VCBS repeat-containing protein [Asgard group archaeon]
MAKIIKPNSGKLVVIISIIILSTIVNLGLINPPNTSAHNKLAQPIELFSLWNDTSPIFDGLVDFNSSNLNTEWSSGAVYNLFDSEGDYNSKLLIKNDNTNLYIGFDLTSYQIENPTGDWGSTIYLDLNHNGILDNYDIAIRYLNDGIDHVYLYQFSEASEEWVVDETGTPGVALSNNVLVNSDFGSSFFELTNHRQYEIRIPFIVIDKNPGEILGIGFEAFEDFDLLDEELIWPYIESAPSNIRMNPQYWGDLFLGYETGYSQYSIEQNFNIKSSAIGMNNGAFLAKGDINGDGDQELIVSSNRTEAGDTNLLAIFDYLDGELTRIWSSWTTSHQTKLFLVKGIATYDFDGNGEDEIYVCGDDTRLLRFSGWNIGSQDFDESKYVFTHSTGLTGTISIGDVDQDGNPEIVAGDQIGQVLVLRFKLVNDMFENDDHSPFLLPKITGKNPVKIYAIQAANMDSDVEIEILTLGQLKTSDDKPLSKLQILQYDTWYVDYEDNTDDDLPFSSYSTTQDNYGHTIIVGDIDNDAEPETVIVGQDYLRVFGKNTFTDSTPPLEFEVNDGTDPMMGGGAHIDDFDQDGFNELIFSFNNGTVVIMNVTDSGGDVLSYNIEWTHDLGSCLGKRNSILSFDFDSDSETEIILSDNFGQIFILGKSDPPTVEITSPTTGSTTNQATIQLVWESSDDHMIHHYDIEVEGTFVTRLPGSQTSAIVPLSGPTNFIEITAFDVNNRNSSSNIEIGFTALAPEVFILFPSNNYYTKSDNLLLEFDKFDPNYNFDYYEIYRNDLMLVTGYTLDTYLIDLPLQGLYNITIVGVDTTSYTGKSSVFVTRDYTPPYIDITNPLFGSYVSSSEIELRWTTSDLYSEVSHFDVYMNGEYYSSTTDRFQTIELGIDQYYVFEVQAFDILGNNKSDTVSITKDTIAPSVEILSHTSGSIIQSSSINLEWLSSDNYQGSGVLYSEVYVNQELQYVGSDQSAVLSLGQNGLIDIQVISIDRAGNSKSSIIYLTLDNEGPYVEIISPVNNYNTSLDVIPLSWIAQDNGTGIEEFQILIDSVILYNITDVTTTSMLVPIPSDRSSVVTVRAIDSLNQFTEDSITVNHSASFSSLILTNPIANITYLSAEEIDISWIYGNISDITSIELFVNESSIFSTTNISESNYLLDLSFIPIDIFPEINITIAYFALSGIYTDTKWIVVDRVNPFVNIITPANNTIIFQQELYILWNGYDVGVGLCTYELAVNSSTSLICSCTRNYFYLDFETGDGIYQIVLNARDKAGNIGSITYYLTVQILMPIISTNLTSIYYTPTGEFQFNLNIEDSQAGIQKHQVLLDGSNILLVISYPILITEATSYLINITETDYIVLEGSHNLEIIIIDSLNRESLYSYTIIVDSQAPEILDDIYFDNAIIESEVLNIEIKQNSTLNNHSISITVDENELILKVVLTIIGTDYLQTKEMIRVPASRSETVRFEYTFNITDLERGNYQILIQAYDFAGNSDEIIVEVNIKMEFVLPWYLQGLNIVYFIAAFVVLLIFISIVSVSTRKRKQNKNWIDEIVSVLYIKSTGLTCVSVNYIPDIVQDEQLIGGAMVAIQSILNEYSGKRGSKIRTIELGSQSMLILQSNYGICALIVKELKPIHKTTISKFTSEFEKKYNNALKTLYFVDSTSFDGSTSLVEKYFGTLHRGLSGVVQNGITKKLEEYKETIGTETQLEDDKTRQVLLSEKTPIDELLESISREAKNQLIKIIERAPKIIILILEEKIQEAERLSYEIQTGLNFLIRIEKSNFELQLFIQNMNNLLQEINYSIIAYQSGDRNVMQQKVERASQIWFEDIAEKWSDIV